VDYRIQDVGLWLDEDETVLVQRAAEKLLVPPSAVGNVRIVRKVLDARKKGHPRWILSLDVAVAASYRPYIGGDVASVPSPLPSPSEVQPPDQRPIIVGTGPAGLFCALGLLERGVRSVLLERGKAVGPRRADVAKLFRDGTLDPESNMSFGEGGAGAFTDGKLTTRITHPLVRKVIETFARFGAPERILAEGKPHIGSDLLPCAVEGLRTHLVFLGCEVHFGARVTEVLHRDGAVFGVRLADGAAIESDRVILAPGNSARDFYERYAEGGPIRLEAKPFAIGFRVEHPQGLIDEIQYGRAAGNKALPPADYKLAENPVVCGRPRGVYSFCMCPGGIVVPTPTDEGFHCTNGMSNSERSARFANAGVVISVGLDDFAREGFVGPLAGLRYQRKWEKIAYDLGGGRFLAPAAKVSDFLAGRPTRALGATTYGPGLAPADLDLLFSDELRAALRAALRGFDRKMRGFASDAAVLIGIESRTSAPVRIVRGDDFQSAGLKGLYPCGEGAGYSGGIVSSGVDGFRVAEQIAFELGGAPRFEAERGSHRDDEGDVPVY
jgi:uncharacterized FAD-dependent dehydrogenase